MQGAYASRLDDAEYIAAQQISDAFVLTLRAAAATRFAARLERPLAKLGGRVVDPERLAAMLPESVSDPAVGHLHKALAVGYRRAVPDEHLTAIAAFLRSDTGTMLHAVVVERQQAVAARADGITIPRILPEGCLEDLGVLTEQETEICRTFMASPAAEALRSPVAGIELVFLLQASLAQVDRIPIQLNASYMIRILEADGVVTFPNRVARRNVIDQLRQQQ